MKQTLYTLALVILISPFSFSQFDWMDNLQPNIVVDDSSYTYSISEALNEHKVNSISMTLFEEGGNLENAFYSNDESQVTPNSNTLYQAGSISKPVAALGVMVLARKHQLDLDTEINTYLRSWKLQSSQFDASKVTIRNLLSHTAGLSVHGFMGYKKESKVPEITEILQGKGNSDPVELAFFPDTVWRYSGGGYEVLHLLIEDISGEGFATFMKREVLEPIGMSNSTFSIYYQDDCHNCASAYNGQREVYKPRWYFYPESAAAGLWTTGEDLAKFLKYLNGIYNGDEGIVSSSEVKQMFSVVKNNYGLGFFVEESDGELYVGHSGKNIGFSNEMSINLNTGRGYVIMSDSDGAFPLINEIKRGIPKIDARGVRPQVVIKPIDVSTEAITQYVGKYSFTMGNGKKYKVKLVMKDENLVILDKNTETEHHLIPTGEGEFSSRANGIKVAFSTDGDTQILIWDDRLSFQRD